MQRLNNLQDVDCPPRLSMHAWAVAIGAMAVTAQLVLVWCFEFFPSIDGPAHVHLAHAMYEALRGDGFYGSLVEFNNRFNPNMATQGVLVGLMAIAQPAVAEKIWLSLYFVSFAGAGAYTLSGINRNSLCLLPLLIFCSISFPLAFGFYNFSFSTVVFLAWFGYWWRHRNTLSVRVVVGHGVFALIACTTHIFAFVVTLLAIGITTVTAIIQQAVSDSKGSGTSPRRWLRTLLSHGLPPLLGSLPALLTCLHFLLIRFGSRTSAGAANLGLRDALRLNDLLTGASLAPYDYAENRAAMLFVLATILLLLLFLVLRYLRAHRDADANIPFGVFFAGFCILYMAMPEQWIVRWMPYRFQPLVLIALLLWLAALLPPSITRLHWKIIGTSGLLLLLYSTAVRFQVFARLDGYQREFVSAAPYIAENSTLIGLRLHNRWQGRPFPANLDVLIQAGSRIASMRHSVDLKNFQGQSNDHPIQFRPGVSATAALGGDRALTSLPPQIRLMEYERETGRSIDYVLIYGFREEVNNKRALSRLDSQLEASYHLVYVSKPLGLVRLYERYSAKQATNTGS